MGTGGSKNKVEPSRQKSILEMEKNKENLQKEKIKIRNEDFEDDQIEKPVKYVIEQDKEKIAQSKLSKYEEIQYSPKCHQNDIADALPDFMWDQKGKDHLQKHLDYKKLGKDSDDNESANVSKNFDQNLKDNKEDDPNEKNVKQSMGLANIMNKYNMTTTNDIKRYGNKNISIKTKKKADEMGEYNETLIFVQKINKNPNGVSETDTSHNQKHYDNNKKNHINHAKLLRLQKKKKMTEDLYKQKEKLCPLVNAGLQPTLFLLEDVCGVQSNGKFELKIHNNNKDQNPNHDDYFKYKNSQNPNKAFNTEPFKMQDVKELNYSNYMFGEDMLLNMKKEREILIASNMYHNSKNRDHEAHKSKFLSNQDHYLKPQKKRGMMMNKSQISSRFKSHLDDPTNLYDSKSGSHSPLYNNENSCFNKTKVFEKSDIKFDKKKENEQGNYMNLFAKNQTLTTGPISVKDNFETNLDIARTISVINKPKKESNQKYDKINRINTQDYNQGNEKLQKAVLRKNKGLDISPF